MFKDDVDVGIGGFDGMVGVGKCDGVVGGIVDFDGFELIVLIIGW